MERVLMMRTTRSDRQRRFTRLGKLFQTLNKYDEATLHEALESV
jgi:hypothetical protein